MNYIEYFLPEIKAYYDRFIVNKQNISNQYQKIQKLISAKPEEKFEEKRRIGENDNYICQLIQKDSIEDFIIYVSKNNISLNSKIPQSIYETNIFLINNRKDITLIEYESFYGSLQIIQ